MTPRSRLCAIVLLAGTLLPPAACADQYMYLDLPQATAALARVRAGDIVHHFCAPCGDAKSERMTVRALGIDRIWDREQPTQPYRDGRRTFWALHLNDTSVDLAYVYVRDGRRWRNLAHWLGLEPSGVPALLPADRVGTRWRCGTADDPDNGNPYWTLLDVPRDPCPIDLRALALEAIDAGWR